MASKRSHTLVRTSWCSKPLKPSEDLGLLDCSKMCFHPPASLKHTHWFPWQQAANLDMNSSSIKGLLCVQACWKALCVLLCLITCGEVTFSVSLCAFTPLGMRFDCMPRVWSRVPTPQIQGSFRPFFLKVFVILDIALFVFGPVRRISL